MFVCRNLFDDALPGFVLSPAQPRALNDNQQKTVQRLPTRLAMVLARPCAPHLPPPSTPTFERTTP